MKKIIITIIIIALFNIIILEEKISACIFCRIGEIITFPIDIIRKIFLKDDPESYFNQGLYFERHNKFCNAIEIYTSIIKKFPDSKFAIKSSNRIIVCKKIIKVSNQDKYNFVLEKE